MFADEYDLLEPDQTSVDDLKSEYRCLSAQIERLQQQKEDVRRKLIAATGLIGRNGGNGSQWSLQPAFAKVFYDVMRRGGSGGLTTQEIIRAVDADCPGFLPNYVSTELIRRASIGEIVRDSASRRWTLAGKD